MKDPKEFFVRSIRGMLPKNRLYPQFLKNLLVYNGPNHDLHELGLPQFDTLKPINFNRMFGIEINPEDHTVEIGPESDPKAVETLIQKGFKIKEDKENHLRDFMRVKKYSIANERAINNINKKIQVGRDKLWKKILMKNYTYL